MFDTIASSAKKVNTLFDWCYLKIYPILRSRIGNNKRMSRVRFNVIAPNLFRADDPISPSLFFSVRSRARLYFWPEGIQRRLEYISNKYQDKNCRILAGDVVFDVGANIGEFSVIAASSASAVYSFDPDPAVWAALKNNGKLYPEIEAFPWGLGEISEERIFYLSSTDADSSFIPPEKHNKAVAVNVLTLDDIFLKLSIKRVDFLKLEAEGYEPEILKGADKSLCSIEKIAVDISPERYGKSPLPEVKSILEEHGFNVWVSGSVAFAKQK